MYYSGSPTNDYLRYDADNERWLATRPVCECCGEPIQEEQCFCINGELICENCISDYMYDNFRVNTENYIQE